MSIMYLITPVTNHQIKHKAPRYNGQSDWGLCVYALVNIYIFAYPSQCSENDMTKEGQAYRKCTRLEQTILGKLCEKNFS